LSLAGAREPTSAESVRADDYVAAGLTDQLRDVVAARALTRTDDMIGRLLKHVDLSRDTVMVVGATRAKTRRGLTMAALAGPGVLPGLLGSATLGRTGFVHILDVAPTVLNLLGVDIPQTMHGTVMSVTSTGQNFTSRTASLRNASADGVFRDTHVEPARRVLLGACVALAVITLLVLARIRRRVVALEWGPLAILGFVFASYAAGPLHFALHCGGHALWSFLALGACVFAVACMRFGRRYAFGPLTAALAAIVALELVDLVTGARLQLNTLFGYSATDGIRVQGAGNMTFALLSSAVVLLVGLLCQHSTSPRMRWCVVLLVVTLVVMAAPAWGDKFGAALAATPAFALLAWLLLGKKIRPFGVVLLGGAIVVGGFLFGLLDLVRPRNQRSHIGRFFEQVRQEDSTN
jgi:hypothetical protein